MIIATPMNTDPIMMANAMFWSSSISLRTENGAILVHNQKVKPNKATPRLA